MKLEELNRRIAVLQEGVSTAIKEREDEIEELKQRINEFISQSAVRERRELEAIERHCLDMEGSGINDFTVSEKDSLIALLAATRSRVFAMLDDVKSLKEEIQRYKTSMEELKKQIINLQKESLEKDRIIESMSVKSDKLMKLQEEKEQINIELRERITALLNEANKLKELHDKEIEKMRDEISKLNTDLGKETGARLLAERYAKDLKRIDLEREEVIKVLDEGVSFLRGYIELIHKPGNLKGPLKGYVKHRDELRRLGCKIG